MRRMALRDYLSPHLDDAVFSCGGLIARQISAGDDVQVVPLFAGDPPAGELTPFAYELHRRWGGEGSPMGLRRAEDLVACSRLGATVVQLGFAEAIYRRSSSGEASHPDAESLFGLPSPEEESHIAAMAEALERTVARQAVVPPEGPLRAARPPAHRRAAAARRQPGPGDAGRGRDRDVDDRSRRVSLAALVVLAGRRVAGRRSAFVSRSIRRSASAASFLDLNAAREIGRASC